MALRGLPSQLPEYLAQLPRLSGEINGHFEPEPGKNRDDFEQLVKLKLRATEPSFVLPKQLRELIWRQSRISRFRPEQFSRLSRLTHLNVSYNALSELPVLPVALQVLDVSYNQLSTLSSLSFLPSLRAFHAQFNLLETIPQSICECAKLQSIKLNDNRLFQLPNLDMLELHELDLRNNRLSRLPLVWDKIVKFKISGNFSTIPGPYLGTAFLTKDLKFNSPADQSAAKSNELSFVSVRIPVVPERKNVSQKVSTLPISTETRHVTHRKLKAPKKPEVPERPASSASSKSSASSSSSKSSITSLVQNDENVTSHKKHTKLKSDLARKAALENYRKTQVGKENNDSEQRSNQKLSKCVSDCIRKPIGNEQNLTDGILFIRAYNARRKKGSEAIIVELPGPRDDRLTPQKARRNAERFASTARDLGFTLHSRDVLDLNEERLVPFLVALSQDQLF